MKNILLSSIGRRVELAEAFLKEIYLRDQSLKIFAIDANPNYSAACQLVYKYFKSPKASENHYIDFVLEKCKKYNIGMIIPTIDTELSVLAKNLNIFNSRGILPVISDLEFVNVCRDKRLTANFFADLNLSTPKIYQKDKLKFPCFVKPYSGSSSINSFKIEKEQDLSISLKNKENMMFAEFVGDGFSEYTVDMYFDRLGKLKCLVPRQRIEIRAGEVSKGITRKNYVYEYVLSHFHSVPGARGCITLQLFFNSESKEFYFIEINPRFGGGFPLSYSAKANYPGWLIDEYFFEKEIPFFDNWEEDLLMLRYDSKILIHGIS